MPTISADVTDLVYVHVNFTADDLVIAPGVNVTALHSSNALGVVNGGRIENHGFIEGLVGMELAIGPTVIDNTADGVITAVGGMGEGISCETGTTIINAGIISATTAISQGDDVNREETSLDNSGIIIAATAFNGKGAGNYQQIVNTGSITGDVFFGSHDGNYLDDTNGHIWGTVNGGTSTDTLIGGNDAETFIGHQGNDMLIGAGASDYLDGGRGADILTGGDGSDTFVFSTHYGKDEITDFEARGGQHDVLDFTGLKFVASLDDVKAVAIQHGNDLILRFSHQDMLILDDVKLHTLTSADFSF